MRRPLATLLLAGVAALGASAPAQGATDPLFVFTPSLPPPPQQTLPPPTGRLFGPCGLGVDSEGRLYVSDYYHHVVDVFSAPQSGSEPWKAYVSQVANVDPQDGPCGLGLNSTNQLFVNNYHRNVTRFNASPSFGTGTVFPLPSEDTAHHLPTGVAVNTESNNVYVNHRTYVSVFDSVGNPVLDEGVPLKIGEGSLIDAYGVAVYQYSGTYGYVYVPDAGTGTVQVFDPAVDKVSPVATVKSPFGAGAFVSLRDSAIAVDRVTGDFYFADNLQPEATERPQASIYVYSPANTYKGRLKYNVVDTLPPGLAVDNSDHIEPGNPPKPTQGRVYVTSGYGEGGSVYAYGPGSATFATPLPPIGSGLQPPGSSGSSGSGLSNTTTSGASTLSPGKAASTTSAVTQVKNARVSVSGRLDYEGLPTCPYAKIQSASTRRALSNCRRSLVGRGSFSAEITPKGQETESHETRGRLLVFKGEMKDEPVLYGRIYSTHPVATSFVIAFKISKVSKGDYGTALTAVLPASLKNWGDLTGIEMSLRASTPTKARHAPSPAPGS